jgi:hypothetical protein
MKLHPPQPPQLLASMIVANASYYLKSGWRYARDRHKESAGPPKEDTVAMIYEHNDTSPGVPNLLLQEQPGQLWG